MLELNRRLPHQGRHAQRGTAGMTLIELLVVMTILAMLASLFPLAIQRTVPSRRLAAAAQSLAVHLRELQSLAALSGQPLQLFLDPSGYNLQQPSIDTATCIPWPHHIEATLKADEEAQAIQTLTMYPDGSSSGGRFELRIDRNRASVTVSPLTGHVRVSR
jgi:general secretion pathway protein H